jgi:hypothetical protein
LDSDSVLVLSLLLSFDALDARDKVFALGSFIHEFHAVEIDYGASESTVFRNATRRFLETYKNYSVLGMCRAGFGEISTWAIDFSHPIPRMPLGRIKNSCGIPLHLKSACPRSHLYQASGHIRGNDILFEDEYVLLLWGIRLGVLCFVGSSGDQQATFKRLMSTGVTDLRSSSVNEVRIETLITGLLGLCYQSGQGRNEKQDASNSKSFIWPDGLLPKKDARYHWNKEPVLQAYQRTLCADLSGDGRRMSPPYTYAFNKVTSDTLVQILTLRRLATTSQGHWCLVQFDAQPGDIVMIAKGANTPFLLRKTIEQSYMFVGECYVHGFMDGEAFVNEDGGLLVAQASLGNDWSFKESFNEEFRII